MRIKIFSAIISMLIVGQAGSCFAARLTVPAELSTQRLKLTPRSAPAEEEGRIYYDSTQGQFYYSDGAGWKALGGAADNKACSKIIAAWNSLGSVKPGTSDQCEGDGTACSNSRADYTCDGLNDGSTINSAITSLGANGGIIYLLEGFYDNNSLDVHSPYKDITIMGQGAATVLKQKSGHSNGINITNTERITVSNLTLDGNNLGSTGAAIFVFGTGTNVASDCLFENIRIVNGGNIILSNARRNIISNVNIDNGLIFLDSASDNIVKNCNLDSGNGISAAKFSGTNNADYNIITSNRIKNSSIGINIGADAANNHAGGSHFNTISYNYLESNTLAQSGTFLNAQIRLDGSSYNRVSCNTIRSSPSGHGITVHPFNGFAGTWVPSYNIITGNRITDNLYWGIYVKGGAEAGPSGENIISDNLMFDNAATFGEGPRNDYAGEILIRGSNRNVVSGNLLFQLPFGFASVGVKFDESSYNYLSGTYIYYPNDNSILISDNSIENAATGIDGITLEPGSYTGCATGSVLTPIGPVSYMRLDPAGVTTLSGIASGKAAGDILILENIDDVNAVTIPNNHGPAVLLNNAFDWIPLNKRHTLVLIWDGTRWVQLDWTQNQD